jgi:hypothetical protein
MPGAFTTQNYFIYMAHRFDEQYNALGLKAPSAEKDPREKAEIVFYAACQKMGFDPAALPIVDHLPEAFRVFPVASYKLEVITKAILDGKKLDPNSRQRKWGAWFWMDKPGFRFIGSDYAYAFSYAGGGSRLCSWSEQDATFIAIECIALWADFHDGKLPD